MKPFTIAVVTKKPSAYRKFVDGRPTKCRAFVDYIHVKTERGLRSLQAKGTVFDRVCRVKTELVRYNCLHCGRSVRAKYRYWWRWCRCGSDRMIAEIPR
jgi:hypothetical protein